MLAVWTKNRHNLDTTWTVGQFPAIKEPYLGHIGQKTAMNWTFWTKKH
jgi:hypothetical protein